MQHKTPILQRKAYLQNQTGFCIVNMYVEFPDFYLNCRYLTNELTGEIFDLSVTLMEYQIRDFFDKIKSNVNRETEWQLLNELPEFIKDEIDNFFIRRVLHV